MKAFYSLLKISPNSFSGDAITIGIVLRDKSGFRYKLSENKKSIAKKLLTDNTDLIEMVLKQISLKIQEVNTLHLSDNQKLFKNDDILKVDYFKYLSNYSNGFMQFSSPSLIEGDIDETKFNKLFNLYVDRTEKHDVRLVLDSDTESNFIHKIQKKLIERVQDKVHTNIKVDNKVVPSLLSSHIEIDCLGKNGAFVGAKSLSMQHDKQTINRNVNTFSSVIAYLTFHHQMNLRDNSFYLISDEPTEIGSPEHQIWEQLNKAEVYKVINSEQSDLIAKKIEDSKAGKFLAV